MTKAPCKRCGLNIPWTTGSYCEACIKSRFMDYERFEDEFRVREGQVSRKPNQDGEEY